MPTTPFPVSGIVYDVDGSTALANVKVGAYNHTNSEWLPASAEATTNSSGEYTIDLANFSSGWNSGDVIYLFVRTEGKNAVARAILAAGDTSWEQDLYLKEGELITNDVRVASVLASCGSAKSIELVEIDTDRIRLLMNISANGTQSYTVGKPDLRFREGYWVLVTAQGTNKNNQSSGVSNAIGDTASNATNIITVHIRE